MSRTYIAILTKVHRLEMPATPTQRRWYRLGGRSRPRIGAAKRMDWMLREVHCIAKPGTEREILERLVQQEVDRMRSLGESAETIAEFEAAAAVHIALRGAGAAD